MIMSGDPVEFTAGPLGLLESERDPRFADATVLKGDRGWYRGRHPLPSLRADNWHLVDVEISGRLYVAPVHRSQFRPARGS